MSSSVESRGLMPAIRREGASAPRQGGESAIQVTVVVLNYNGQAELAGCLESLRPRSLPRQVQVLVADNGSTDGSVQWLAEAHPEVRVVEHGRNWGFAQGINRTVEQLESPFFALLNNDTRV